MNINLKGNIVVKSIALAGFLSVSVFLGGHISEAAGFSKNVNHKEKVQHEFSVKGKSVAEDNHVKSSLSVEAKVDIDVVKVKKAKKHIKVVKPKAKKVKGETPNVKKDNKSVVNKIHSQAAEHASENAKLHAAPNSAVLATETNMIPKDPIKGVNEKTTNKNHNDAVTEDKNVADNNNDVITKEKDVDNENDRVAVTEDKNVANNDNDAVTEEKDVDENHRDVTEDKNVANNDNDAVTEEKDVDENHRDAVTEDKNVAANDNDAVTEEKDVDENDRDAVTEDKNVADNDNDAVTEEKDVAVNGNDAAVTEKNVVSNPNTVNTETEVSTETDKVSEKKANLFVSKEVHSQAKLHASEQAKIHASNHSAVLSTESENSPEVKITNTIN